MNKIKLISLIILTIVSHLSKAQTYSYNDIFKTNKVFFFGYDFTNFKLVESDRIGKDEKMQTFIFEVIQIMNEGKTEKVYARYLKKDTVEFVQNNVNQLNSKIPKESIIATGVDIMGHSIPKDSLQAIINKYDTKGMSGVGFVQIIECFYKPKKTATIWYVFFDISSKKILDAFETSNNDADSYHGLSEYWAVGVGSGLGSYLSKHYYKARKNFNKTSD